MVSYGCRECDVLQTMRQQDWQHLAGLLVPVCDIPPQSLIICLAVDVPKGRLDAERWAGEQRGTAHARHSDGQDKVSENNALRQFSGCCYGDHSFS